ncbi:MAG: nucleotidyltransferase [Verrucomicrobiota bacterium]
MEILNERGIPFLVGGAYALREYTGVVRDTKDFDIFLCEEELRPALRLFRAAGYRADIAFPHWLAKVHHGKAFIDLVFRAGNGLCEVDARWFRTIRTAQLLGVEVRLVPPEFMIWQKAYIMERERFDGADVTHLIRSCASGMDWEQLVALFGPDWRVLLSHLILFGFIYPEENALVPPSLLRELLQRLTSENEPVQSPPHLCRGTLLSRQQYLDDVERWGYHDARLSPRSRMSEAEIRHWTDAIDTPA